MIRYLSPAMSAKSCVAITTATPTWLNCANKLISSLDNTGSKLKYDQFDTFGLSKKQICEFDEQLYYIASQTNVSRALSIINQIIGNRITMIYMMEYYCPTFDWMQKLEDYENNHIRFDYNSDDYE